MGPSRKGVLLQVGHLFLIDGLLKFCGNSGSKTSSGFEVKTVRE
jgi:hypothetical protein